MIVRYVNNMGQSINLNQAPYRMLVSDLIDYEPDVLTNNGKILGFDNDVIVEREIDIDIHRTKTISARKAMNDLSDHFNLDVIANIPGRLYINDWYLNCYIYARETERWGLDNIISCNYKIITDCFGWITETTFDFSPQTVEDEAENVKQYDYTYPYVYPKETVAQYINNDHYDTADFKMTIFGERSRVYITIGGNIYHVEYPIAAGEYMVIDSRSSAKTGERIYLVKSNGEKVNLFDYRDPDHSVFTKVPTGKSPIDIGGKGVTITLYKKRSEPKWS